MSLIKKTTFLVSMNLLTVIGTLVMLYFLSQFWSKLEQTGSLNAYEIFGTLVSLSFLVSLPWIVKKISYL